MAFVQMLGTLVRDKAIGKHVVPIVPDESRTFGMEGMFRQLGIWSSLGQLYKPQDADQLMYYRESKDGQVLQEGINEGGAMSSWIVAATSYSTNNVPMIPFYIYYSMFGLQRVGDLAWLAGDIRAAASCSAAPPGARRSTAKACSTRTATATSSPARSRTASPTTRPSRYEVVTIIRDGMRRMYAEQEDVYYYVTLMNENYPHPGMPEGSEAGILKGLYQLSDGGKAPQEGPARAADGQRHDPARGDGRGRAAEERLRRRRRRLERDQLQRAAPRRHGRRALEPAASDRAARARATSSRASKATTGPVVAATDYMRNYADQVREYVQAAGRRYTVLGTDGFGRSDYRVKLRRFFEVDRWHVAVAALKALADDGAIKPAVVAEAIAKYGLDAERAAPWTV